MLKEVNILSYLALTRSIPSPSALHLRVGGGGGSVIYSDSQDQLQSHPSRSAALVLRGEIVPSE